MVENEKIFRTKTGFCHILPDKIVLTRDGILGNISKVTIGNNISRILLIYTGLSALFLYFANEYYKNNELFQAILFAFLGLYLIYGIISSINNSATPG